MSSKERREGRILKRKERKKERNINEFPREHGLLLFLLPSFSLPHLNLVEICFGEWWKKWKNERGIEDERKQNLETCDKRKAAQRQRPIAYYSLER
jgi:hypothetical protein